MNLNGKELCSKLPTPLAKRPALSTFNNNAIDVKRSRLDLRSDSIPFKKTTNLRRSKSVTSLQADINAFRKENIAKPKKPVTNVRDGLFKAPSTANLTGKAVVSAPVTKLGKRPAWDVKGKLEDLTNEVKEMQKASSNQGVTIEMLREQVSLLKDTNRKEREVVQLKSSDCDLLSSKLENANGTIKSQECQIQDLLCTKDELTLKVVQLETQLRLKDEQILSQQTANYQLENENRCIKNQLTTAKSQLSEDLVKIEQMESNITSLNKEIESYQNELQSRENELFEAERIRRQLHNEVQELKGNIRVFCRVRPSFNKELKQVISFSETNKQQIVVNLPSTNSKAKTAEFLYDKVFLPTSSQSEVFQEISQLVQSSLDGYNVCIFAYGQTGSGKTFTMEGTPENSGMITRALCQIFKSITYLKQKGWEYQLNATYIEVYNETIRDLLAKGRDSAAHEIKMTEGKNDVFVTNLNVVAITSEFEVEKLLKTAQKHRAVAATMCNEHSSRSHSVFQLQLSGSNSLTGESCRGSLNLVDLAGSERLKESQSEGDRLRETKNINKSLSNLGNVIMSLAQKADHIPYRNSKLTYLLMNCLGGNSKTLMFVNVSPEEEHVSETISSLRFAKKVNNCQIGTATRK